MTSAAPAERRLKRHHLDQVKLRIELVGRLPGFWDRLAVPISEQPHAVVVAYDENRPLNEGLLDRLGRDLQSPVELLVCDSDAFAGLVAQADALRTEATRLVERILAQAIEQRVSDVYLRSGAPPMVHKDGSAQPLADWLGLIEHDQLESVTALVLGPERWSAFRREGDADLAVEFVGRRFRLNVARKLRGLSLTFRPISTSIPSFTSLGIPSKVLDFVDSPRGLLIVSGPTGSGKSTTLAAMLNDLAKRRNYKFVTLEDPIEYVFEDAKSIFDQRSVGPLEYGNDCESFARGLRAAMRQHPNVIMVGEMRDRETMAAAIEAAETGHLVVGTLHSKTVVQVFERMTTHIASSEREAQSRLSQSLVGVVAQRLLPRVGGGSVAACEILTMNSAVANLVRDGQWAQIYNALDTGSSHGMQTFEAAVAKLLIDNVIDNETALQSIDPAHKDVFERRVRTLAQQ